MIMKAAGVKGVDINTPLRIQGAFVKDDEVEKIVNFIKVDDGNYDESVISEIEKAAVSAESDDDDSSDSSAGEDELTNEVIEFLVKKGKASIGLVQRRFRIGYNRAARIIEDLEERGIVGPDNGTKGRAVYMDKAELYDRKSRYEDM
jgi:S-DNA-T family DNA segregation ATPase FtsK/SpoIIIE